MRKVRSFIPHGTILKRNLLLPTNASIYHSNIKINKITFFVLGCQALVAWPFTRPVIFYRSRSRDTREEYSHPLSYTKRTNQTTQSSKNLMQ
jgi:hypothetical protein